MVDKYLSALEVLYKTTLDASVGFDEKVKILLSLGRDVYGLSLGILSRVEGDQYTVMHIVGPEGAPPPGTIFDLSDTYCVHTLGANRPKSFHHAGQSEISDHPCYKDFQLEAYIGAPIFVDNVRYGTLNFSSAEARDEPFSEQDHSLINLCAQWIGGEIFRMQSRDDLQQQKALFESMFQSVPDAVIIANTQRQIKLVNPSFTRMFGYVADEVCGKSSSMLYADEREWTRQGQLRYNPESQLDATPYQVKYKHKSGRVFWSESTGAPLRDPDGQVLGYLVIGRDITDRLQAETAKQEFVSIVSHELRTPLTSISGSLELIQSGVAGEISDAALSMIEIASRNSKRLVRLINDLLDAEKIQSGEMQYTLEDVDLNAVLDQSLDEMKGYGDEFDVRLVKVDPPPTVTIKVDRDRFLQVMTNLISNAIKVSPTDDCVDVGVIESKDHVRIFVRDHGSGIPKDVSKTIFERFTQADSTTTRKIAGTGLGLNITQALVVHMGGKIAFETQDGKGTTFFIDFPIQA